MTGIRRVLWVLGLMGVLTIGCLWSGLGQASQADLSLAETAQTADLIFAGTVAGRECREAAVGGMILTDVYFKDVQVFHASARSRQAQAGQIRLTHGGGQIGRRQVAVSAAPSFIEGQRYLVFALDDDQVYTSPVVGALGQMEIMAGQEEYLLAPGGRAILSVGSAGLTLSSGRVRAVKDGLVQLAPAPPASFLNPEPPQTKDPAASATRSKLEPDEAAAGLRPLSLKPFMDYVLAVALKAPLGRRTFDPSGQGKYYRLEEGRLVAEALPGPKGGLQTVGRKVSDRPKVQPQDDWEYYFTYPWDNNLFACGSVAPYMYTEDDGSFQTTYWNQNAMAIWNHYIDLFRSVPPGQEWSIRNQQNEILWALSDQQLKDYCGLSWGTSVSICISLLTSGEVCSGIAEVDIAFSSQVSWTDNFNLWLRDSSIHFYPTQILYETGHAWGLNRIAGWFGLPAETFAYEHPSVMNRVPAGVIEDGWGVHVPDVYLMRNLYVKWGKSVPVFRDMGVESYFANAGLVKSTTDRRSYRPGDQITVRNIVVENLSSTHLDRSRVGIQFYLTTDTNNLSQIPISPYWTWGSFLKETYDLSDYQFNLPEDLDPGTYYVGAMVMVDGTPVDDFPMNNATWLSDKVTITK